MDEQHAAHDVAAIAHLRRAEERLREAGRRLELNPARYDEARQLFHLAGQVRAERLELLDRWQLN